MFIVLLPGSQIRVPRGSYAYFTEVAKKSEKILTFNYLNILHLKVRILRNICKKLFYLEYKTREVF